MGKSEQMTAMESAINDLEKKITECQKQLEGLKEKCKKAKESCDRKEKELEELVTRRDAAMARRIFEEAKKKGMSVDDIIRKIQKEDAV